MSRRSSPAKHEDWKHRVQRYEQSNQTISKFCFNERVSVASFFLWRKKVRAAARSAELAPLSPDRTGRFQPVVILESARATVIRLGSACKIELGSDLTIVEAVLRQLLAHYLRDLGQSMLIVAKYMKWESLTSRPPLIKCTRGNSMLRTDLLCPFGKRKDSCTLPKDAEKRLFAFA